MRRHAEPFRYFSNRIAPLGDLADSLFLKFRGKTWCAHRLLLCSNYRADLSTGSGALQTIGQICLRARGHSNYRADLSTGSGALQESAIAFMDN
ncbi:hypothetical protein XL30_08460 [Salmonella enterica subsp. enterica serovar Typhimurium]|uniref:Uncharacterized protein n=1 Tax=Salmonella enterica TaxID=28901 RepID=A0A5U5GKU5_SALER|nr:hypothetical protein [Salmonella enterica]EBG0125504.1 hypothetical protein [Salmonella enterica subsp. enterica serovar Newport]EBK2662537.1 hypothetical protein [Salmonella enterica subsp. enterica serovar Enteritidis]EBM9900746.1 hypothetical protein [Salmonella enterica subsp. enterica serovar Typhimurium]ECB7929300.1 hypothetical protein [Salmonella enterica subsp. enterica serovar Hvittingfoss]EDT6419607.1 hypothetical protein [Salmonella enterica subsp. enterica]EDX1227904.1 hypothe